MTADDIRSRLEAIIERAEYAGRQDRHARTATAKRAAANAREAADLSARMARQMADQLAADAAERPTA